MPGLPLQEAKLKLHTIILLLRSNAPRLYNGTPLKLIRLQINVIHRREDIKWMLKRQQMCLISHNFQLNYVSSCSSWLLIRLIRLFLSQESTSRILVSSIVNFMHRSYQLKWIFSFGYKWEDDFSWGVFILFFIYAWCWCNCGFAHAHFSTYSKILHVHIITFIL